MLYSYVLVWTSSSGEQREYRLEPGRRYYIGRPAREDMETGRGLNPFHVYIIDTGSGEYHDTGIESLSVSRRHVLLEVQGDKVVVADHGPHGKGSRHGTVVNGRRLGPAEQAVLRPGDTFRLGGEGPAFTLALRRQGETLLTLQQGVPQEVPASVARGLEEAGIPLQVVAPSAQGSAVIVVAQPARIRVGGLVVETVQPTGRKREGVDSVRVVYQAITTLMKAERLLEHGREEEAVELLTRLDTKPLRETLEKLDPTLAEEIEQLLSIARISHLRDTRLLTETVRRLVARLEPYTTTL